MQRTHGKSTAAVVSGVVLVVEFRNAPSNHFRNSRIPAKAMQKVAFVRALNVRPAALQNERPLVPLHARPATRTFVSPLGPPTCGAPRNQRVECRHDEGLALHNKLYSAERQPKRIL